MFICVYCYVFIRENAREMRTANAATRFRRTNYSLLILKWKNYLPLTNARDCSMQKHPINSRRDDELVPFKVNQIKLHMCEDFLHDNKKLFRERRFFRFIVSLDN